MDLEIIILSEVSQKEKDKYYMISLICGILKYEVNEHIYEEKQTHRHREEICGCQEGGKWGRKGLGLWD